MNKTVSSLISISATVFLLTACSWSKKDETEFEEPKPLTDYHSSRPLSPLEVPPDLISDTRSEQMTVPAYDQGAVKYSDYSGRQTRQDTIENAVATPSQESAGVEQTAEALHDMYIERAGSQRWLVVRQPMNKLWPRLNTFVLQNGLTITREDRNLGIIETDWAENHASNVLKGSQKYLAKWLGSLYTTGTRDKYRIRVEPGREPGNNIRVTFR